MSEKWVTWYWLHHSRNGEVTSTTLASDPPPRGFANSRPATDEEIAAEKQKREDKETARRQQQQLEARPDYKAATAIRDTLEWMTPEKNPLKALTVAEWEELRRKLEAV